MRNRLRRLRMNEGIRAMVRENAVSADDLVYPVFVAEGNGVKKPIDSMPGIFQFSLDTLGEEITRMVESGVRAVLLFGIPS